MGIKVSIVLIVTFLITMMVFVARPQSSVAAIVTTTVVPTAAATHAVAPTRIVLRIPTSMPTEVIPPTRIMFNVPTSMPTTVPTVVPTAAPTEILAPVVEPTTGMHADAVGDAVRGEDIFRNGLDGAPPCMTCHSPTTAGRGSFSIGPGLMGIHERAATRVEGETAEQYLSQSIRQPAIFLVPGFNPVMPQVFGDQYSEQDIADLVAYLMSL